MHEEAPAPDILFTGVTAVFTRLANLDKGEDVLVVGDVSPARFRALEAERDRRGQHCRLFYQPETESLIITVPTLQHEGMHLEFNTILLVAMANMGAHTDWRQIGTTTFNPADGSSGQGDSGGSPIAGRRGSDWPTLVIEAGVSQTLSSLQAQMRWWFSVSGHEVKVVILIKMHVAQETLHLEEWVETAGRPGATSTRWATRAGLTALQPACERAIDLIWVGTGPIRQTPAPGRTPSQFRVVGSPLIIRFSEIFLRAPGAGEHDLVISNASLQVFASRIWQDLS